MKFSKKWFEENGFTPCSYQKNAWILRFNVYSRGDNMRLDAEIFIGASMKINVYDGYSGRAKYAPWYAGDDTQITRVIKKKIDKKLNALGITSMDWS